MIVRKAKVSDMKNLPKFLTDFYMESLFFQFLKPDFTEMLNFFRSCALDDKCYVFVVYDQDQLVGLAMGAEHQYYFTKQLVANEMLMYIKPEYRGTQAASYLFKEIEKWAKEHQCILMHLAVNTAIHPEKTDKMLSKSGWVYSGGNFFKEVNYEKS